MTDLGEAMQDRYEERRAGQIQTTTLAFKTP
jgi:hypothetical protein